MIPKNFASLLFTPDNHANVVALVEELAAKEYGNRTYIDEDKMVDALVRRGVSRNAAIRAIIEVTSRHLRPDVEGEDELVR